MITKILDLNGQFKETSFRFLIFKIDFGTYRIDANIFFREHLTCATWRNKSTSTPDILEAAKEGMIELVFMLAA